MKMQNVERKRARYRANTSTRNELVKNQKLNHELGRMLLSSIDSVRNFPVAARRKKYHAEKHTRSHGEGNGDETAGSGRDGAARFTTSKHCTRHFQNWNEKTTMPAWIDDARASVSFEIYRCQKSSTESPRQLHAARSVQCMNILQNRQDSRRIKILM